MAAALYNLYEETELIIIDGELYVLKAVRPGAMLDEVCDELIHAKEHGESVACRFNGILIHSNMSRRLMEYMIQNGHQDWMI